MRKHEVSCSCNPLALTSNQAEARRPSPSTVYRVGAKRDHRDHRFACRGRHGSRALRRRGDRTGEDARPAGMIGLPRSVGATPRVAAVVPKRGAEHTLGSQTVAPSHRQEAATRPYAHLCCQRQRASSHGRVRGERQRPRARRRSLSRYTGSAGRVLRQRPSGSPAPTGTRCLRRTSASATAEWPAGTDRDEVCSAWGPDRRFVHPAGHAFAATKQRPRRPRPARGLNAAGKTPTSRRKRSQAGRRLSVGGARDRPSLAECQNASTAARSRGGRLCLGTRRHVGGAKLCKRGRRARHRRPLFEVAFRRVVHWNLRVIHRFRRELREWGALAFAGYAAFAYGVVAVAAYLWLPGVLLAGDSFRGAAERATAFTDARGSVLQLLAGLVVLAGAYLTARTLRLNRAGHISDRFSKGVDQLGHVEIQTRVGGVYALERVMRDAPLEQRAVLETLVAFLRERRALSGVQLSPPGPTNALAPPPDAAAALRVIGRRRVANDPEGPEDFGWNLTEFDLRDFSLRSGNFSGVNLWRTDLRRANLKGADLSGVKGFNQAVLADAVYDEGTRFPTGFDPAARGLRMAQDSTAAPGEPVA